ncbi:hypothetical protein [Pseudarthrobacter sp. CCNWLW247]|uniref:hypothetical protein n=1 Tax=Pseudarthrobacter sp. CCNWLW247 TaxID=3127461 RepID=UPI0030786E3E
MENPLYVTGNRSGTPPKVASRRRAGLPAKRFFSRFRSLSDVPASDLKMLSERITMALDLGHEPDISALRAALRHELRNRESALND